jgi:lambda family phage portal protein
MGSSFQSNFIPAKDIIHLFRKERPGQARGIPWSSANIIRIKDLYDFQDAQLMRQKIAALFAGFVHDIGADQDCPDTSDFGETLEPGTIEELPPGKTITFATPPGAENYKEFINVELHAIASGYGISYESLTNDLSEVNFSSARMGWLDMNRNFDKWRNSLIIFGFLRVAWDDFKEQKKLTGMIISKENRMKHISPKREMIDPTKEIPAIIKKVRAGLSSLSDEIVAQGKDPDDVFEQLALDQAITENKDLKLDSNPKYTNVAGSSNEGLTNNEKD